VCEQSRRRSHQDERERIAKRAGEGRAAAKAAGRRFGRKPKLDEHQSAEAQRRLADGESFRAIARSYRVSHTTISRLGDALGEAAPILPSSPRPGSLKGSP
jgi:DNA invertase Pin-like site-specific DNA recombinase